MRFQNGRVHISAEDVRKFNNTWPGSPIEQRPYWAEFDSNGLCDHSFPEFDVSGNEAVAALIKDAEDACRP